MSRKMFYMSSTLFLLWFCQISNADVSCTYYKANDSTAYQTWCSYACCSSYSASQNTTCCYPIGIQTSVSTSPGVVIFGYQLWIYFLCAICLLTALCILIHYVNRIHFRKHFKSFNSQVDPALAFTISKSLDAKANDASVVLEQNPPSYTSCNPPPPPYLAIICEEKKLSE